MAKKIAIANIKGGVSKTTTSVTLACELSKKGKTLLCDLDPQGSASSFLGVRSTKDYSISHLIEGIVSFEDVLVQKTDENGEVENGNLHILPSDLSLLGVAKTLESSKSLVDLKEVLNSMEEDNISMNDLKELINDLESKSVESIYKLKEIINKYEHNFDYIVFDCSPYDNILVTNVFVATEYIIIPLKLDKSSMEGYDFLIDKMERIKMNYNKDLQILGVLPTMYRNTNLHKMVLNDLKEREELNGLLFDTHIRTSIKVEESPFLEQPVTEYSNKASASRDYLNFTNEVLDRLKIK